MTDGANDALLVRAWKARNSLYEELFGTHRHTLPKRYTPPGGDDGVDVDQLADMVAGQAFSGQPDEGNLVATGSDSGDMQAIRDLISSLQSSELSNRPVSILIYPPAETRPYWLYLTAGLSNPWYQKEPEEVSGFGCEFMVKSKRPGLWPVRLLRRIAYYISSYSGTLSPGVFLNLKFAIGVSANHRADLTNLFVWYADEAPDAWYQLPSGGFGLFCAVGITEDEMSFAESIGEYGAWSIQQVLRQTGIGQVTDPRRESVMLKENIGSILFSVRNYAENFRPSSL